MALNRVLGTAGQLVRQSLGISSRFKISEIIGLDSSDPTQYSYEAPCDDAYGGAYLFYLHILCDPTEDREERGQEMANAVRDHIASTCLLKDVDDYQNLAGVWLDIGTKRFWAG